MSNKPRIYVSSTIYDFADLRSALKYWLEEFDFEVQMSEFNDFEVNLDLNSFQACLDSIKNCDYFILLIGGRRGALFNEKKEISITQQEYRTAYDLVKKGEIKIISFIRKSVWDIKEDRKSLSESLKDKNIKKIESKIIEESPEFIFQFIDEVRRAEEMKQAVKRKSGFPINNWIYKFDSYKDIFEALKRHLNLTGNLQEKAIKCNLMDELERNVKESDIKFENGKYSGNIITILNIKTLLNIKKTDNQINIKKELFMQLAISFIIFRQNFRSFALKEAIKSGIFLEYDRELGKYEVGKVQRLLLRLNEYIEQIGSICSSELITTTKNYLINLIESIKNFPTTYIVNVDLIYLISIFSLANIYWNIYQISTLIYEFLNEIEPREIELYPVDIFSEENKEIIKI
ncbi:MAG: DUF4062 domain-containing protein [Candidatus Hodarchaeota archaeon]